MDFTHEQLDILFSAWAMAREGGGIVVVDTAVPAAHWLAEAGWLERRIEGDGELSWWWTETAETALALGNLTTGQSMN